MIKCQTCHTKFKPYRKSHRFCTAPCANRSKKISKRYGITPEEIHKMYHKQKGRCAICQDRGDIHELGFTHYQTLSIDHDHETGDVRGLICQPCNLGLGHFKDHEEKLRAAVKYLKKHRRKYHG